MQKRIYTAFAAGVVFGAVAMTASSSQAGVEHQPGIPYGFQPVIVTQRAAAFEAPYCVVSERHRRILEKLDGTSVRRGPWSPWVVVDEGHPVKTTDGTICAVQH